MSVLERIQYPSAGVDPDGYLYEIPNEPQSTKHLLAARQLEHCLLLHLSRAGQVEYQLSSDMGVHSRAGRGNPYQMPGPDILVYIQAPPDRQGRQSIRREEDGSPDLALEILWESWIQEYIDDKQAAYEAMHISEYWLYGLCDPQALPPRPVARVQGFRLTGAGYTEIAPSQSRKGTHPARLWDSAVLQTAWGLDAQEKLRLLDPRTDDWYSMPEEHYSQCEARGQQLAEQEQQLKAQGQQIEELKAALARYPKPRET